MKRASALVTGVFVFVAALDTAGAAIILEIDYRYDTNDFFGAGNTDGAAAGAAAKASLEAAADFFESVLIDTLDAIPFADPNTPGGQNTPVWRQVITHPTTGASGYAISSAANAAQDGLTPFQGTADEFRDISVAQDTYLIYAGSRSLGGSTAGQGGPGGVGFFGSAGFNENISNRGKPDGEFVNWGGVMAFDSDGSTNWHYDHASTVGGGLTDLYSVALHEFGHALGINLGISEFLAHVSGSSFTGPAALAAWNADNGTSATSIPLEASNNRHWKNNAVFSNIAGTNSLQEAAMDPSIQDGTRKHFTNVDTFALADIGWTVVVPEPTGLALVTLLLIPLRRRRS